jgi:hypothetical protein
MSENHFERNNISNEGNPGPPENGRKHEEKKIMVQCEIYYE